MLELLADLGAEVAWTGPNELRVHTAEVAKYELDPELCGRMRASFLLAGPLLARFGRVTVPPPGGDLIGRRRLDPHIHAFARMGAAIDQRDRYEMNADGRSPRRAHLPGRGQRDGDREHRDGRRADAG